MWWLLSHVLHVLPRCCISSSSRTGIIFRHVSGVILIGALSVCHMRRGSGATNRSRPHYSDAAEIQAGRRLGAPRAPHFHSVSDRLASLRTMLAQNCSGQKQKREGITNSERVGWRWQRLDLCCTAGVRVRCVVLRLEYVIVVMGHVVRTS